MVTRKRKEIRKKEENLKYILRKICILEVVIVMVVVAVVVIVEVTTVTAAGK